METTYSGGGQKVFQYHKYAQYGKTMPLSTWPTYPDDLLCSSPDDVPQGCDFSGDEVQVASADYPAPPLTTLSLGS